MQRTLSTILTLLLIFHAALYLPVSKLVMHIHERAVKEALEKGEHEKELLTLRFSGEKLQKLEWVEAHEFRYEGEMYDVTEVLDSGQNVLRVVAYKDVKESRMEKRKEQLGNAAFGQQDPASSSLPSPPPPFKYLFSAADGINVITPLLQERPVFSKAHPKEPFLQVPIPPPQTLMG